MITGNSLIHGFTTNRLKFNLEDGSELEADICSLILHQVHLMVCLVLHLVFFSILRTEKNNSEFLDWAMHNRVFAKYAETRLPRR